MLNDNFTIGNCHISPIDFSIKITGQKKQSLQPKFIEVLCYLAKHYPRIIPRDELIDNIWGRDSYVGDKSLTNAIWYLRKSLNQVDGNDEVIETIRKAGYRLLVKPHWQTSQNTDSKNNAVGHSIDNIVSNETVQHHTKTNKITLKQSFIAATFMVIATAIFILSPSINDAPFKITTITQQPGSELFPAISPDGRYLVYSQVSTNQPTNLFMLDTWQPKSPTKQLTFDSATEGHSVWSNDGQYLYFSRKDKANNYCKYIRLKVSSQQETPLANCPLQGVYYYIKISSDDKTLAIYNRDKLAKRSGIYFLDVSTNINATEKPNKLVRFSCDKDCKYKDRDMAFSPNGKYIAVSRRINRFDENIHLVNLKTKKSTQLTFGEEDIVGLTWHSDSDKIIYGAVRADIRHGFVLDIKSKSSQALNLVGFSYPSYAKNSHQLFYQQRIEGYYLNSLPLNNSIASSSFPVIKSHFNYNSPDYHAGNNLLIFTSNESGFYELWSSQPNGSNRKQLTNLKKNIHYPKWSHDGSKVAFLAPLSADKGDSIYIYSLADEKVSLLKSPFKKHNRPSWSFDDKKIISAIYAEQHTDLYSINIKDASTQRLTFDNARFGIMTSDSTLFYTKLKRGLWQKTLSHDNNKNKEKAISSKNIIDGALFKSLYAWSYEKGNIYYHKNFSDHQQLLIFSIDTQKSTPLVRLPLNSLAKNESITYLPKLETLIFSSVTYPQANIKRIDNLDMLN